MNRVAAPLLFLLFACRYYLAAMGKGFWNDESLGLGFSHGQSFRLLLYYGSDEASPAPLFYLLDKIWYSLWGSQPQYWWDLRLFHRILPATYWALACTYVFSWSYKKARDFFALPPWQALAIALGVAGFLHSCSFMNIYAIEARAYSLWLSLSVVQFLAWIDLLQNSDSRSAWWRYGAFSALLAFTTFASMGQVGMGVALLVFWRRANLRRAGLVLLVATAICLFYFRSAPPMHYSPDWFTAKRYFDSIFEVIAKSFHHHGASLLALSLPLLFVALPLWKRRNKFVLLLSAYNLGLLAFTIILFKGSEAKGGIWISRYVIYLIPSFTAQYLLALGYLAEAMQGWAWLRGRIGAHQVFALWAILQAVGVVANYGEAIVRDLPRLHERRAYGYTPSENCRDLIPNDDFMYAVDFEQLNDVCRGLKSGPAAVLAPPLNGALNSFAETHLGSKSH